MKKLFTLALLACAAVSANAVTLWTGSCSFSQWSPIEGDERPVLKTSDFTNAVVGDKLELSISDYGEESWREIQIYTWDGAGSGSLVVGSGGISGLTSYAFTLDESLLATLKETDVCFIGTGYTVTQIDLDTFNGTIWEGECVCANWDASPAVRLEGSAFALAQLGDQLVFYVEVITPGAWAAIQIDTSNWTAGPFGQNVIADGQTEVSFVLNEDLLNSLQTDGINITGSNFKLTKIELVSAGDDDDDDDGDDDDNDNSNVIWSGSMSTVNGWDKTITLDATAFGEVKATDTIAITVTEAAEDAQIAIRSNPDWEDVPSDLPTGDYISVNEVPGVYDFPINDECAEEINAHGLVITGTKALTITKIELISKGVESGVKGVDTDSLKGKPVYNLQGVKVADSIEAVNARGLYIVGGKKVMK